ncbi:MAG: flavin reductase family protein [Acetobacter aceti]|uniref:flavin reductase family protein n=1 Tax=Acetobacter aceti TaxID=435 RepID=UPI001656EA95|nr:flavin reductase family protein [Acetobacter aceti]
MDIKHLRRVFGQFATGVTVIVGLDSRGEKSAFTATSFNTVSLEPPLAVFSVSKKGQICSHLLQCETFIVNVLAEHQADLSDLFGRLAAPEDRVQALHDMEHEWGARVPDALAAMRCVPFLTQDIGNHMLFVVRVVEAVFEEGHKPLVFFSSRYQAIQGLIVPECPDVEKIS